MTESRIQGICCRGYAAIGHQNGHVPHVSGGRRPQAPSMRWIANTPSPTLAKASMPPVCSCLAQSGAPLKR